MLADYETHVASGTALTPGSEAAPRLFVLDLKTTGFSPDRHEIIQIAAARLGPDCAIAETFATYVRPRDCLPWHVTLLTGIRNGDVANAPTAPEALRALGRFVGNVGEIPAGLAEPLVASHDGRHFALRFISAACARHALPVRPVRYIDSLQLARILWPAERLHNLDALAGRLGLDVNAKAYRDHDARADVRLLSAVMRRMLRLLPPTSLLQHLKESASKYQLVTGS